MQKGTEWAERHSWTKIQFTQTKRLDTNTNKDIYKVNKNASGRKQRDSRTNRVIEWAQEAEWAQTPTRADTNTLKVGTSNTNSDTNRVTVESLPWSS